MADKQEKQVAVVQPAHEMARFNWTGLNPSQMKGVAQAMALSGMFPDIQKDSAKAFVKIMAGQEMGIPPFQAMSDISIIQGKAAAGGNIYAAKVKASGRYDYRVKRWDRTGCEIEFSQRKPDGKYEAIGVSSFTEEDAKDAQLLGKDSWKKYPRNMYFNRAMTAGVRTYCPDALNGINAYTPEELGANVDEDGSFLSMPSERTYGEEPNPPVIEAEDIEALEQQLDEEIDEGNMDIVALAAKQDEQAGNTWVVPEYPPSKMARPEQVALIKRWQEQLALTAPDEAKMFVVNLTGKDVPATNLDAMKVLNALADRLNQIAEAEKAAA